MFISEKRRLIKDPVWGNLEVFPWETKLLNHFLFNRLHNIVQNSSAYKVYPGLKYSRFLHTVGVAHVATQLFLNTSHQADAEALDGHKAPADAMRAEAKRIQDLFDADKRVKAFDRIKKAIGRTHPCSVESATMLAAIRMAALLHDIGHLPFSHVFENAIEAFLLQDYASSIPITTKARKRREELGVQLLKRRKSVGAVGDAGIKLHELLGTIFVEVLQQEFDDDPDVTGLLKAAALILAGETFPISRGFIVGTIDADRIDFVRRDGMFSGLFNSSVDFERLFAFYELAKDPHSNLWKPRPSSRAISEKEKLLLERFQDYKYIVVHHRVHLYDEIMENILVRLMASGRLDEFLSSLCGLLTFTSRPHGPTGIQTERIKLLRSLLTCFDDPWIEIKIREVYNGKRQADEASNVLFDAYVEDRRSFVSAFKSDDEFKTACREHAPALGTNPSLIRTAFDEFKYVFQHGLTEHLQRTVLIGSTEKKLNYGIKNDDAAEFYGVEDLKEFLKSKKVNSLMFNFWYEQTDDESRDAASLRQAILPKALKFLEEKVIPQLSLRLPATSK